MYRDAWHRICVFGRACSLVRVHVIEMIGVIERKIGGWRGRDGRTDGRTDGGGLRRGKEGETQSDEEKGREFMEELSQGEREYAKTGPAKTRIRTETDKYPTHRDTDTHVF